MARKRLQWPFKGQVDSNARGDQPDLTTSDSQNVRNYAGGTERLQGGQRPGLAKAYTDQIGTGNDPVRHVTSLVYDRPPFDYAQVGTDFSDKWSRKMDDGGYPLDMIVSPRDDQVYITSAGSLTKLNANGVQQWTFPVPVNEHTLVPRLQHDDVDIYYVALNDSDGSGGLLYALQEREEQDGVDILFIESLPRGSTADFLYRAGSLFVAANDEPARETFIHAYSTVQTATPTYVTAYDAPFPIRQIGYMNGGLIYAADAEKTRNQSQNSIGGIEPSRVDGLWTPLDLSNYEDRIHCWIDAYAADGEDAGTQSTAPDVKQQYLDAAPAADYPQRTFTDDTERGFTVKHAGGHRPLYDPDGLVIHPAWRFRPGAGYASGRNDRNFRNSRGSGWVTDSNGTGPHFENRLSETDRLERSKGLFPRTREQTWAVTFLVRSIGDEPMILWVMDQAKGNWDKDVSYNWLALTLNIDETGEYAGTKDQSLFNEGSGGSEDFTDFYNPPTYPAVEKGKWCLYAPHYKAKYEEQASTSFDVNDTVQHPDQLLSSSATGFTTSHLVTPRVQSSAAGTAIDATLSGDIHLVTLVFEKTATADVTKVYLRVNGVESTQPCFLRTQEADGWGQQKAYGEILGSRFYERIGGDFTKGQGRVFMGPCEGWNGWLCEAISYMGTSAGTGIHNQAYGDRATPGFFDDVENIEAYMAWKWGVASYVLKAPASLTAGTDGNKYHPGIGPNSTGSPTGNTINLGDGTRVSDALNSTLGITGKISAVDGKHQWAYAGPGMGWTVTCDEETGSIYTTGPQDLSAYGLPSGSGPAPAANTPAQYEFNVTARKLVDVGPLAYIRRSGFGALDWNRCPEVGDKVQLVYYLPLLSTNKTKTLEFIASAGTANISGDAAQYPVPSATGAAGLKALLEDSTFVNQYLQGHLFAHYQVTGYSNNIPLQIVLDPYDSDTSRRTMRWYVSMIRLGSLDQWGTSWYDHPLGQDSGTGVSVATTASTANIALWSVRHQMFSGSLGVRDTSDAEKNSWAVQEQAYGPEYHANHGVADRDGSWYIAPKYLPVDTLVAPIYAGPGVSDKIRKYSLDGNILSGNADKVYGARPEWEYTLADPDNASAEFSVSCLGLQPVAEYKYPTTAVSGPEYLYGCNDNVDDDGNTTPELKSAHKIALIQRSTNNDPTRKVKHFAVRGSKLFKLDPSDASPTWADMGTITRGFAAGQTESYYTSSATVFGQKYFVNNGAYYKYDPVEDAVEAVVADKGEIPEGCRLTCFYRGRWVVARGDKDPYSIHASAVGEPKDWDFFSLAPKVTGPFSGANQDTASNPDVVNALAPFYDDVLIVGGENSITQYRGDLSSLGQIDYFTDSTGFAFGDSWCLSPSGTLYFFGSRGGVWAMKPKVDARTVPPVEITATTIAEQLRDVNLQTHLVRLVWDYAEQGFHVFITPINGDNASASQDHWYYCERTQSWWKERFNGRNLQPFAATLLDGDTANDRKVAIAGNDGYLRHFVGTATNDDGTTIISKVLIGPVLPPDVALETRINALHAVLENIDSGCDWALYASDDPGSKNTPVATGTFGQGRNPRISARARGAYMWLELSNVTAGGRWAIESIFADIHNAGRKRDR